MTQIKCQFPFDGYVGYRVYHSYKDRYYYHMTYHGPDPKLKGRKRTTSVARYLMSVKMGYELGREIEVDHINGISSDDRLENLQILSRQDNRMKSAAESQEDYLVTIPCAYCGTDIERYKNDIVQADRLFCNAGCEKEFGILIARGYDVAC